MIATIIITAFVGVLLGFGAAYVHMQFKALKNAKTYLPPAKFPVPTVTIKEIRESDRIEEEYKKQLKVERKALSEWGVAFNKTKCLGGESLRESIEAGYLEKELSDKHDREKEKLEALKQKFKEAIAKEAQPSRPHKGISLEQILAIPRCDGYSDDRIRKLFGNRHYMIPQTIADADIPAEDKLWALFHLMGTGKKHRLAMESGARASIIYPQHSFTINSLWDIVHNSRHKVATVYKADNPHSYWDELQWQIKRAVELMEEND